MGLDGSIRGIGDHYASSVEVSCNRDLENISIALPIRSFDLLPTVGWRKLVYGARDSISHGSCHRLRYSFI